MDKHQMQAAINAVTREAEMYGASDSQIQDMIKSIQLRYTEVKNTQVVSEQDKILSQ